MKAKRILKIGRLEISKETYYLSFKRIWYIPFYWFETCNNSYNFTVFIGHFTFKWRKQ